MRSHWAMWKPKESTISDYFVTVGDDPSVGLTSQPTETPGLVTLIGYAAAAYGVWWLFIKGAPRAASTHSGFGGR